MSKMVFETTDGSKLIGVQLPKPESSIGFGMDDGIWIQRAQHVTFLATDTIVSIRPATAFDREIDGN